MLSGTGTGTGTPKPIAAAERAAQLRELAEFMAKGSQLSRVATLRPVADAAVVYCNLSAATALGPRHPESVEWGLRMLLLGALVYADCAGGGSAELAEWVDAAIALILRSEQDRSGPLSSTELSANETVDRPAVPR